MIKKCIYWSKLNNIQPSVKVIKDNLLRFLNIQLEIHNYGNKKDKLNRIWEAIMSNKTRPKQAVNSMILLTSILVTWRMFSICINITWITVGYICAMKIFHELYGLGFVNN